MAATATPDIYDPKNLALMADFSITANTNVLTAPSGEAGVKITSIMVCNKTTTSATLTLKVKRSATYYVICSAVTVPGDGLPFSVPVGDGIILNAADEITGNAGTASALDLVVSGIEMKD